ncbi:hypothetical protein ACFO0N_03410 [Halobium salinum]|uniref:Uncharacterized protein n=1 Tax=Halobium salinum TaxID=1364940 RepID=A0ABD5P8J4_9EURY|nr:hypothetical protein [Halobium salinum]
MSETKGGPSEPRADGEREEPTATETTREVTPPADGSPPNVQSTTHDGTNTSTDDAERTADEPSGTTESSKPDEPPGTGELPRVTEPSTTAEATGTAPTGTTGTTWRFSPRVRKVGGALFVLTGLANVLLGAGLLGFSLLGGFAGVPPATVAVAALPILGVGLLQAAGGVLGYLGRFWPVVVGIGVIALVGSPLPVLIPVKLFALVALTLTEDQFRRRGGARR